MLHIDTLSAYSALGGDICIGVSANVGMHTNELIAGVCQALGEARAAGMPVADRIHLRWRNDGRDPAIATGAAKAFAEEGVKYVLGHLSASAAVPASLVYTDHRILFFAPATSHPDLTDESKPTIMRVCGRDEEQGIALFRFAKDRLKARGIVLIVQDLAYGHSLAGILERLAKVNRVACTRYPATDEGLGPEDVDRVRDGLARSPGSIIMLCGLYDFAAHTLDRLRQAGYAGHVIAGDDCHVSMFHRLSDAGMENVFLPCMLFGKDGIEVPSPNLPQDLRVASDGAYFQSSLYTMRLLLAVLAEWPNLAPEQVSHLLRGGISPRGAPKLSFSDKGDATGIDWCVLPAQELFADLKPHYLQRN